MHNILLLQVTLALIVSYIYFNLGENDACGHNEDLVVGNDHITLRLRKVKEKKALGESNKNTR